MMVPPVPEKLLSDRDLAQSAVVAPRCLRLVKGSLSDWRPDDTFDLITCVHGLHYIGDKIGLISRAVAWLSNSGQFVANLDASNLKCVARQTGPREIITALRRGGLTYDRRRRLLKCNGPQELLLDFRYLGADDRAGPNYTGQEAVDSYYE